MGEEKYLHDHTTILARVVETNLAVKYIIGQQFSEEDKKIDDNRFNGVKSIMSSKIN